MAAFMSLSLYINQFMYSSKGLRILQLFSWVGIALSGSLAFLAYGLHFQAMTYQFGTWSAAYTFSPYLIAGLVVAIYQFIFGTKDKAWFALFLAIIPSTLTTEFGIVSLIFFTMAGIIARMERKHRQEVVGIISGFSKQYSPVYQQRFDNRMKYKQYKRNFRLLDLMAIEDFALVKEVDVKMRDLRTGLRDRELLRTFKIKGVFGKTTVTEDFYIAPQKRRFIPKRKVM